MPLARTVTLILCCSAVSNTDGVLDSTTGAAPICGGCWACTAAAVTSASATRLFLAFRTTYPPRADY